MMRLVMIVIGVVIVIAVAGWLFWQIYVASQDAPLPVAVFAGAELVGQDDQDGFRRELYTTASPAEEVAAFYRQETSDCTRIDNTEQGPDQPAFSLRCSFDASSLYSTRYTVVTVQPGVGDDAGQTLIQLDYWWDQ